MQKGRKITHLLQAEFWKAAQTIIPKNNLVRLLSIRSAMVSSLIQHSQFEIIASDWF